MDRSTNIFLNTPFIENVNLNIIEDFKYYGCSFLNEKEIRKFNILLKISL